MVNENIAKVVGRNLPISTKHSVEISKFIRGRGLAESRKLLGKVVEKKLAIPMGTFNRDTGHKTGIGPGRYPNKASRHFIQLLDSLEANAINKGLDVNSLYIMNVMTNKGSNVPRYSKYGRKKRNTNVEIIAAEKEKESKPKGETKE